MPRSIVDGRAFETVFGHPFSRRQVFRRTMVHEQRDVRRRRPVRDLDDAQSAAEDRHNHFAIHSNYITSAANHANNETKPPTTTMLANVDRTTVNNANSMMKPFG